MIDHDSIERMIQDKCEVTTIEQLEEIRQSEAKTDLEGEARIVEILKSSGSLTYRNLRRTSRMRAERLKRILENLERQGKIKTLNLANSRGPGYGYGQPCVNDKQQSGGDPEEKGTHVPARDLKHGTGR